MIGACNVENGAGNLWPFVGQLQLDTPKSTF